MIKKLLVLLAFAASLATPAWAGDLALGDLEAAVEKYRRCTELDPQFFDGWHALGMALYKLDRYEEAIMSIIKPNLRSFLAGRDDQMINRVPL